MEENIKSSAPEKKVAADLSIPLRMIKENTKTTPTNNSLNWCMENREGMGAEVNLIDQSGVGSHGCQTRSMNPPGSRFSDFKPACGSGLGDGTLGNGLYYCSFAQFSHPDRHPLFNQQQKTIDNTMIHEKGCNLKQFGNIKPAKINQSKIFTIQITK